MYMYHTVQYSTVYLGMEIHDDLIELHDDHCNVMLNFSKQCTHVVLVKQPQGIHYDRDIDEHVTHSHNNQSR